MAMTDYPYPAEFLEPMPGHPVREAVKPFIPIPTVTQVEQEAAAEEQKVAERSIFEKFMDFVGDVAEGTSSLIFDEDILMEEFSENGMPMNQREWQLLTALQQSTSVYFNYTGKYPCTNLSDWEGTGDLDGYGWNILACNQLAMPIGYGPDGMFIPTPFDYEGYTAWCQESFGLTPNYNWALDYFGGYNIDTDFLALSNIIMSNGELDPWRAGGLNKNVTADGSGIALYIEGGAHHLDLRLPTPLDPPALIAARNVEREHIFAWIKEYQDLVWEPEQNP